MNVFKLLPCFLLFYVTYAAEEKKGQGWDSISPPPAHLVRSSQNWDMITTEAKAAVRDHTVSWGKFSAVRYCSEDSYIWGYTILRDKQVWQFNRIDFYCYPAIFPEGKKLFHPSEAEKKVPNFNITHGSLYYPNPVFAEITRMCEPWQGPLIGYWLLYEDAPTGFSRGVLGFQGICANGDLLENYVFEPSVETYQNMKKINATCRTPSGGKNLACGSRNRFQIESQGQSLVDLDLFCCAYETGVDRCTFEQQYRILAAVDNRHSNIPTTETINLVNTIEIKQTVTQMTEAWDQSSRSKSITDEFLQNRIHSVSSSETNRKFQRESSLIGLFQGFGDLVGGFTNFLQKGAGKLLGALGLGELLGLNNGGLPRLVGESGMDNLVQLGEPGLEYYFKDSPIQSFLSGGGAKLIFGNLDWSNDGDPKHEGMLKSLFTFQGYSMVADGVKGGAIWSPRTIVSSNNVELMKKFLTDKAMLSFPDSPLSSLIALFGLIKLYGKQTIQKMLESGELEKGLGNLGRLSQKSWSIEGLGGIEKSEVLGQLLVTYSIGALYCPSSLGQVYTVASKLGLPDKLATAAADLHAGIYNGTKPKVRQCGEIAIMAYLSKILPEDEHLLEETYENSTAWELLGEGGLKKILEDPILQLIADASKTPQLSSGSGFEQLLSLLGLIPAAEGFGKVLASSRFRKIVGSPRLAEIIGSGKFSNENELVRIAGLFGLNTVLGNLEGVEAQFEAGVEKEDLATVLANEHFGRTFSVFSVGQMLELNQLEKLTGRRERPLSSILEPRSLQGRGIFEDLIGSLVGGAAKALGGIFSRILGTGKNKGVKQETTDEHSETLTEKYKKTVENKVTETKRDTIKLESTVARRVANDTKEIITDIFPAKTLTLILAPVLACDNFFTVGISDRSNYIAIAIPDLSTCDPHVVYSPVATFDYLNVPLSELRSFLIPIGTEWVKIHKYAKIKGVVQVLARSGRPTAGMSDRVLAFAEKLQGHENLNLRTGLMTSLRIPQVWQSPSENTLMEAEVNVTERNYNIVMQLRIRCGDVLTYTYQSELFKFPRVSGCVPKGIWEDVPMKERDNGREMYETEIGFTKGGKSVDGLSSQQRALPEVQEQVSRMLKEMGAKFRLEAAQSAKALEGIHWETDSSLLKNPAWELPLVEKDAISVETKGQVVVLQLVAKCGPLTVRMKKYKVTYVEEKRSEMVPPNAIISKTVPEDNENEECFAHFPC